MNFEPGTVVLLPFPFSDLQSEKRRPVLLLSAPDGFGDFVGIALTSRGHHPNSVLLGSEDFVGVPLPKQTWARADKVFSLSVKRVTKQVARLNAEAVQRVRESLCQHVGHREG